LEFLLSRNTAPLALFVSGYDRSSHADRLIDLCRFLPSNCVLQGNEFRQPQGLALIRQLDLDFIVCVHFPYIVTPDVLSLPRKGVLNLHPAYLPYNRGWHTASWAILEDTPIGATFHFMDEGIDAGDIIKQRRLDIHPGDTANTLYLCIKQLEIDVFKEAWVEVESGAYTRHSQKELKGTAHNRKDLLKTEVQKIELDRRYVARDLIKQFRALTTNRISEASYYEVDGKRYRVQIMISEEPL
jgi:methionyl-tRNA formyltransferase